MALIDKLTNIADAIRGKTGGTDPLTLDAMAEAIAGIETGGVELPTLQNRATEDDVVSSKQFIDESGNLRTGSMGLLGFGGIVDANEDVEISENDDGSKTLMVGGYTTNTENKYVKPSSAVVVMMDETHEGMSVFGDAKPEDVVEGKIFTSKEGFAKVGTHTCAGEGGDVSSNIVFEVEKITSDTYDGTTTHTGEEFILFDIYLKSGGSATVTYGGLTKTITDDGTSEEPTKQQVFFGTFNGISDEVVTPSSGMITITGYCRGAGCGIFDVTNKNMGYCNCVTGIVQWEGVEIVPTQAFRNCTKLTKIKIPNSVKDIKNYAFCNTGIFDITIPDSVTSIDQYAFMNCFNLMSITIPDSITEIKSASLALCPGVLCIVIPDSVTNIAKLAFSDDTNMQILIVLALTPPTLGGDIFANENGHIPGTIIVPAGCGEAYKTADIWNTYADYIVEVEKMEVSE